MYTNPSKQLAPLMPLISFIFSRLKGLMSSGTIVIGGETDESEKYIAPTVITGVKPTDPLMENEVKLVKLTYSPFPFCAFKTRGKRKGSRLNCYYYYCYCYYYCCCCCCCCFFFVSVL